MKMEKNDEGRGVMGCQTVRKGEGKMKSQGKRRRQQNVFTVGIAMA